MKKFSISKPNFKKSSLENPISNPQSLPFMFVSPSQLAIEELKQKQSFDKEILKAEKKLGLILEKNFLKEKTMNLNCIESSLPYKRRARSFSPPKDPLKVIEKDILFFPKGLPVMPIPHGFKIGDDSELITLKEEYLRLLENAQETVITESDEKSIKDFSMLDISYLKSKTID